MAARGPGAPAPVARARHTGVRLDPYLMGARLFLVAALLIGVFLAAVFG